MVRRASVFGLTFHPRMLAWFTDDEEGPPPAADVWERLRDLFDEEPDGYLRFRRSLLRDAAYEGLPFKLRRKLHGAVAAHLEEEMDHPEEAADTLSLHYAEAGELAPAWRYATTAAKRAEAAFANVEAAGFYARALDAGSKLSVGPRELATVQQSLGDAWYRAGEFKRASEAYAAVRPLVTGDAFAEGALMLKLSRVEEKLGNYLEAQRWAEQARENFHGSSNPEAAKQATRAGAWYAKMLQYSGRTSEALEWAERVVAEAEALDDADALGSGYFVMGWAYGELGKEGALPLIERALEAHKRAGNLVSQAAALATLGVLQQWAGRWDEALSYYQQGREVALKIGNSVNAALAHVNSAEILTDRGEWAQAEALLRETLPFWKASQYHYYLAACLLLLGRVSLCLGRLDEALTRLEESKAHFRQVGAEQEVPGVDARLAECRAAMGSLDAALELIEVNLSRANTAKGVARVVPLFKRIQGHVLIREGDLWGARDALEASLAAAKEQHSLFESTLTMLSLIELDRLEGVEPPLEMVSESRSLLASLKVRAVPPFPAPPQ